MEVLTAFIEYFFLYLQNGLNRNISSTLTFDIADFLTIEGKLHREGMGVEGDVVEGERIGEECAKVGVGDGTSFAA